MTSVSTQVDRGRGSPVERTSLRLDLILSTPSAGVLNVREAKSVPLLVKNEERVREMLSMTPPPLCLPNELVDTDVIYVINDTRPSPSF